MSSVPGKESPRFMERRPLGRTGLRVTPLALAAWSMRRGSGAAPGLTPDDVERAYYDHGINAFFLVRAMHGLVEGVRRLVSAGHRDDLVLISMAGLPTAFGTRRSWEKNAEALGVDVIDVFLTGWVTSAWWLKHRRWPELEALKREGRVRAIGFSSHNRVLAARLAREVRPDVLMIRYNAAHRGAEREVFEPLGSARPAVLSYTATRWGMLLRPVPEKGFPVAMTPPECYRFALSHPAVNAALCAARSARELEEDVEGVLQGPLAPRRMAEVRWFGDAVHAAARRGDRWMFRQG